MKIAEQAERGDAYHAVKMIYDKSPGRSWRRLNGALHGALTAAITAHLQFLPDDFAAIYRDMKGRYWMGEGDGECYYNLACKVGHTAACISFERCAGRPAALWSESVKTPERLHVGSKLTWSGLSLTVTSMQRDHLIACAYSGANYASQNALTVGDFDCLNDRKYRQMEEVSPLDCGGVTIRFGPPVDNPHSRKPSRVVKITYEELAAARKKFDAARREALRDIAQATTLDELVRLTTVLAVGATEGAFRHFDTEDIRHAVTSREKALGFDRAEQEERAAFAKHEAAALERWAAGEPLLRFFRTVRLRVQDGRVETSTGQHVSVASVQRALPIILRRRQSVGPVANLMVDAFAVHEQTTEGVKVGCTLVPWSEVERLPALLGACL